MTQQYPGGYYPPNPNIPGLPPAPTPPQQRRRWPWVVGGVIAFFVLVGSCNAANRPTNTGQPYYGPAGAPTAAAPTSPGAPPVKSGPLTQFGDGQYEVGVDVVAGRYKTPGSGEPGIWGACYWERAKNDSGDFSSIISNENLQGPGTVALKPGEFFKTNGGCNWTKQ
jgi:hypothetical protein